MENKIKLIGSFCLSVALVGAGGFQARADEVPERSNTQLAFMSGPSLYETGRVGAMTVADPGSQDPASRLDQRVSSLMPKEQAVEPATPDPNRAAKASRSGFINASILDLEIREQVDTLAACRMQVARDQSKSFGQVEAGRVDLSWTIRSNGTVADAAVSARDPIDLHLLDCVKQQVSAWTFARPRGGMLPVDYSYSFR